MKAMEGALQGDETAIQANRYKVNRGEPGRNVITPLKNGEPVKENLPVSLTSPSSSSFPAIIPDETKPMILSPYDKEANFRFALVNLINEEMIKSQKPKGEIIKNLLSLYNTGVLLPEIYKELGSVSRPTLYRWRKLFSEGGIEDLAPEKGRRGISKITDHEKNLLLTLLLHQNRLKKSNAITLTKEFLKRNCIESASSPRTLRRFADQFEKEHYDLWTLRREGEKALNDKVIPYAERDWRLLEVGEGLVADGHRLNFQTIHPITGKPCRASLVLFWDWRSSYPLGWEIMIEENIQCVATALRNSILTLGKIPKWVLLDNGKAFKAKIFTEDISFEDTELPGMFARLNINFHFAQAYNAQAKPIERIFGILNEQLERLIPSYTGASIEDKPAWTKRNEKLARSLHNPYVPTIEEANELIRAWRDRYAERPSRGRDGLRPIDIFEQGKGPGVDPNELIYLMMDHEIKDIHRNGVTWLGWHWYGEALYGLKDKVVIKYSLSDLSQIYIFHKNEFLCVAKPVEPVHPMASESENPKDMEAVKEVIRLKKRVKNTTRKLCDLLETKTAAQVDWSKNRVQEISETIQKIQEVKKPKAKFISPFIDEPADNETSVTPSEKGKIDMASDHGSPLSCAYFEEIWDMYEWYCKNEPEKFNISDLCWIDWFIDSDFYRNIYDNEAEQRRLAKLRTERPVKTKEVEDKTLIPPDENYNDISRDAAVESRWRRMKEAITVNQTSGLSCPNNEYQLPDEYTRYAWYRGIERRFPGILTDADWKEVKKYEGGHEWAFHFSDRRNPRLWRQFIKDD